MNPYDIAEKFDKKEFCKIMKQAAKRHRIHMNISNDTTPVKQRERIDSMYSDYNTKHSKGSKRRLDIFNM